MLEIDTLPFDNCIITLNVHDSAFFEFRGDEFCSKFIFYVNLDFILRQIIQLHFTVKQVFIHPLALDP